MGFWAGCSNAPSTAPHRNLEGEAAFQRLAHLEVNSDHLYQAVADQADVVGYRHQLEQMSDLAGPLSPAEMERIEQSFLSSLKVMLFDLAPVRFWEHHLAQYYVSRMPAAEAQLLVDGYEWETRLPSAKLQELRQGFVADRLPDLLPEVRTRSHSFEIASVAMAPTLLPGDHVIVYKADYETTRPQRGDILVYRYPDNEGTRFLYRVVGVPGDQVKIQDQVVSVNEEVLAEPYVQHTDVSSMAGNVRDNVGPLVVPPDAYFVLGDNREESLDSRFLGPIGREHILGRVVFIYWSVDPSTKTPRWGRLGQRVP